MAIIETAGRLASTIITMIKTRVELASVEVEEQIHRHINYLLMSLLAMFLFWVSIALFALLVIILFWDTHRIEAVMGMALAFASAAAIIGLRVRSSFSARPALLAATMEELRKDVEALKHSVSRNE